MVAGKSHMNIVGSIVLRQWRDEDLEPFAEMNGDAEVMEFFPKPLPKAESAEFLILMRAGIEERGWGLWAVEVDGALAGFAGLNEPRFVTHFTPCVEIGWRFRREYWGRGIAHAAALKAQLLDLLLTLNLIVALRSMLAQTF